MKHFLFFTLFMTTNLHAKSFVSVHTCTVSKSNHSFQIKLLHHARKPLAKVTWKNGKTFNGIYKKSLITAKTRTNGFWGMKLKAESQDKVKLVLDYTSAWTSSWGHGKVGSNQILFSCSKNKE